MGSIVILPVLFLQPKNTSLHLPVLSLLFHKRLAVVRAQALCLLRQAYSRHLILFDVMVNGLVSLISLFDIPLLVCRNATDLFLAALLNSVIASCHLQTVTVLLLPFPSRFLLFLFLL